MDDALRDLYREILTSHSRVPQGRGRPATWDVEAHHRDPETADEVRVWIQVQQDRLAAIGWEAQGSGVLQASCSLLCSHLAGRSVDDARAAIHAFTAMLTSADENPDWDALGEAAALSGIRHFPARVRCAALPWRTTEAALNQRSAV